MVGGVGLYNVGGGYGLWVFMEVVVCCLFLLWGDEDGFWCIWLFGGRLWVWGLIVVGWEGVWMEIGGVGGIVLSVGLDWW